MVVVTGIVKTSQADIAAVKDAIGTMEKESRRESGCIDYTFSVEVSDPDVLRITEKWKNVDALVAHMATPHMADFQKTMGAHPPVSMEVRFYEAEEIQPFQ
jgi:quinol monooxygenase YgiN